MYSKLYCVLLLLIFLSCINSATEDKHVDDSSEITSDQGSMETKVDTVVIVPEIFNEVPESNSKIVESDSATQFVFDRVRWNLKDGNNYSHREELYRELMTNPQFRSLKQDGVIGVLGEPDRKDNNYLFYTIHQKHLGALPMHTKTMVIKFADDRTIEWIKIHE